jgi:EMC6
LCYRPTTPTNQEKSKTNQSTDFILFIMIDPMADLGSSSGGAAATTESDAKEVFDPNVWNQNMQRIDKVRSLMGILSGCVAGIFGFTGWEGLGTFVIVVIDDI